VLARKYAAAITGMVVIASLGLTACKGGSDTDGTTSGGTSGGATEVKPAEPKGSRIRLSVAGDPCVPSRNGKVTVMGTGELQDGLSFGVTVYHPYGSGKVVHSNGHPYFKSSTSVLNRMFVWEFPCNAPGNKPYKLGSYEVRFTYDGKVIKKDAFDVSEPRN
jgi:hypothetical protein